MSKISCYQINREKKVKDKRFIKNWYQISLLNIDYEMVSKALAARLKKLLLFLMTHQHTSYVQSSYISKTRSLSSDILEIIDTFNFKGYLVAMD